MEAKPVDREKVQLGRVEVPEDKQRWIKYVTKDGTVYAKPPGGKSYTPEQAKKVKAAKDKVRDQFVSDAKDLRDAEAEALKKLRADAGNPKLQAAALEATQARAAFEKGRKTAEAAAKREARAKALK